MLLALLAVGLGGFQSLGDSLEGDIAAVSAAAVSAAAVSNSIDDHRPPAVGAFAAAAEGRPNTVEEGEVEYYEIEYKKRSAWCLWLCSSTKKKLVPVSPELDLLFDEADSWSVNETRIKFDVTDSDAFAHGRNFGAEFFFTKRVEKRHSTVFTDERLIVHFDGGCEVRKHCGIAFTDLRSSGRWGLVGHWESDEKAGGSGVIKGWRYVDLHFAARAIALGLLTGEIEDIVGSFEGAPPAYRIELSDAKNRQWGERDADGTVVYRPLGTKEDFRDHVTLEANAGRNYTLHYAGYKRSIPTPVAERWSEVRSLYVSTRTLSGTTILEFDDMQLSLERYGDISSGKRTLSNGEIRFEYNGVVIDVDGLSPLKFGLTRGSLRDAFHEANSEWHWASEALAYAESIEATRSGDILSLKVKLYTGETVTFKYDLVRRRAVDPTP